MANWYYYNDKNEKIGPISPTVLKELARQGLVTKETKVENSNGRSALAGSINGLTFPEAKQPETISPFELNDFGLTSSSFPPSMNGFDFPDLTSIGHTPDDYDPFASTAPAMSQTQIQPVPAKPFSKPIVLVAVGIGFFFILPIFIYIIGAFSSDGNGLFQRNSRNSTLLLREPPPNAEGMYEQLQKEIGIGKSVWLREEGIQEIFGGCINDAKHIYDTGNDFRNEDNLLAKMSKLKNSFEVCMKTAETYLVNCSVFSSTYPNAGDTVTYLQYGHLTSGCYWNLEQMMNSIKASVKKLDKNKYVHTIELCKILSQYEQAVAEPCESHFDCGIMISNYDLEFSITMTYAELEWEEVDKKPSTP